jgi:hypothetical protein
MVSRKLSYNFGADQGHYEDFSIQSSSYYAFLRELDLNHIRNFVCMEL